MQSFKNFLACIPLAIFIGIVAYANLYLSGSHDRTILYIFVLDIIPSGFGVYYLGKTFKTELDALSDFARKKPFIFTAVVFGVPFILGVLVTNYHRH